MVDLEKLTEKLKLTISPRLLLGETVTVPFFSLGLYRETLDDSSETMGHSAYSHRTMRHEDSMPCNPLAHQTHLPPDDHTCRIHFVRIKSKGCSQK